MKGLAVYDEKDIVLSTFHSYKRIKNATKDKVNGLQPDDADLADESEGTQTEL